MRGSAICPKPQPMSICTLRSGTQSRSSKNRVCPYTFFGLKSVSYVKAMGEGSSWQRGVTGSSVARAAFYSENRYLP